ncbi:hypothetical protein NEIRO03_0298 [Nematocida sp. AWRm78]|nr:hypothetical protein NEIRO02_0299 [Nematocida sp. AWRm79]KAI5182634.1 hypothetical protein NEIRO03_0298 [Nematocida sp. AWRm78]
MESVIAYMRGEVALSEVIKAYPTNTTNTKASAYILFESLKDITAPNALSLHIMAVEKFFRKEYIPGLFSEYIRVLVNQRMKIFHAEIIRVMVYSLSKLERLGEVLNLEERLFLLLKTEHSKEIDLTDILRVCLSKGSLEWVNRYSEVVLEKKCRELYASIDKTVVSCILMKTIGSADVVKVIDERKELLSGISEYNPSILLPLVNSCISYILCKEIESRQNIVASSNKQLIGMSSTGCSDIIGIASSDTHRLKKTVQVLPAGSSGEVLAKSIPDYMLDKHRKTIIDWLRALRKSFMEQKTIGSLDDEAPLLDLMHKNSDAGTHALVKTLARTILSNKTEKLLAESISMFNGKSILLLCEVCNDINVPAGSLLSRDLLMKLLEVSGDIEYIKSQSIGHMLNIKEELQIRYDYYLTIILHKGITLTVSLNLINLIIACGYHSRIVGLAVRLSEVLKQMEYRNRSGFMICNKEQNHEMELIPPILSRIIRTVYIKKKDLQRILQEVIYLITIENVQLVKGLYQVLTEIIYAYKTLDEGVSEKMYGLKKPAHNKCGYLENNYTLPKIESPSSNQSEQCSTQAELSSTADIANNNTMTVSVEIFNILEVDGFSHSVRTEIMELIVAMIQTTDVFLIKRLQNNLIPEILDYYISNNILINCNETVVLIQFLMCVSKHRLTVQNTIKLVFLLMILIERSIARSEDVIKVLYEKDKYSLACSVYYNVKKDRKARRAPIISPRTITKIQKIFTAKA